MPIHGTRWSELCWEDLVPFGVGCCGVGIRGDGGLKVVIGKGGFCARFDRWVGMLMGMLMQSMRLIESNAYWSMNLNMSVWRIIEEYWTRNRLELRKTDLDLERM